MDLVALVVAFAAFGMSVFATWAALRQAEASEQAVTKAAEANEIARTALDDSRRAEARALWTDAIEAVHRVLIDPTTEPLGDRLQTLRIRLIALVDGLPDWPGLDRWLAAEHQMGVALGREILEKAQPNPTVDQRLDLLSRHHEWGMVLAQNLRHLRNVGSPDAIPELRANAVVALEAVYRRNGWGELPPELHTD